MAAKFWVGGGTNTNWNSSPVTNWANSSGGAGNQTAPGSGDDVTFDGVGASANGASVVSASITVLSLTFSSGYTNTVTINTAVPIIVAGNFTDHTAHGWTVNGTGLLRISAASTISSGGKTFPGPVDFTNTNTKTLSGDWTITGILTCTGATTFNSGTINTGGLTMTNSCTGTTTINLTGGSWISAGALTNSITLSGTITITTVVKSGGSITNSGATVTHTGTITVSASTTWDTAGVTWNNITFSANGTHTINSLLTASGTMQINNSTAITFAGTSGFYVNSFSAVNTTAATHTFKNGLTYTIYGFFLSYLAPNSGGNIFTSDDGTLRTNIVLLNSVSQSLTNGRFTRVDASAGRAIWTLNGTVTDCLNIFSLTNLSFVTGKTQVIQGFSNY